MANSLLSRIKSIEGFTLIELLIVITIIGILAVALIPRISEGPAKARDVKRISDIGNLATTMELYYSDYGEYPSSGSFTATEEECLNGTGTVGTALLQYTSAIPADPGDAFMTTSCAGSYYYMVMPYSSTATTPTPNSFALFANLELEDVAGDGRYCVAATGPQTSKFGSFDTAVLLEVPDGGCTIGSTNSYYILLR